MNVTFVCIRPTPVSSGGADIDFVSLAESFVVISFLDSVMVSYLVHGPHSSTVWVLFALRS